MSLNAQNDIASRIEDAVFELMATTPVQSIKVAEVLRLAHTSKSTFYRCYRSVDDVVKRFEDELLQNMQDTMMLRWRLVLAMRSWTLRPR